MALNVTRTDVWAASIEDRPGGLAGKLTALAEAGAHFEFILARRASERPGRGAAAQTANGRQRKIAPADAATGENCGACRLGRGNRRNSRPPRSDIPRSAMRSRGRWREDGIGCGRRRDRFATGGRSRPAGVRVRGLTDRRRSRRIRLRQAKPRKIG